MSEFKRGRYSLLMSEDRAYDDPAELAAHARALETEVRHLRRRLGLCVSCGAHLHEGNRSRRTNTRCDACERAKHRIEERGRYARRMKRAQPGKVA